ncbi:hypothetical protein D3C71_1834040 [compost metagenome]
MLDHIVHAFPEAETEHILHKWRCLRKGGSSFLHHADSRSQEDASGLNELILQVHRIHAAHQVSDLLERCAGRLLYVLDFGRRSLWFGRKQLLGELAL